ncbi:hypothetical protein [Leptolyngbya sp. O-77]|uniref:hypothetical protein n=1 Tax=Leptolyngbya sp. O-77 TaxID=1080068 RepID=UPI00074D347C|nr:hypothetical protein [Leptolyngbya sp. O-77]BAU42031.1 hypothetical protein O77CONTIG1_01849 [Leptolyngbya sp. O-77]
MIAQVASDLSGETSKYPFALTRFFNRLPERVQKIVVVTVIGIKALRDVLKICIVIFLLWLCGYITLKQLLLFYSILLAGIILSAIAPAISSIYSVPSEWIGLQPAMVLFNRFTHENLEELNSLGEMELERAIQVHNEAAEIIAKYLSDSPNLLRRYPEISEAFREVNVGSRKAQGLYSIKKQQRRVQEEEDRQQRLREQARREEEKRTYWQYVHQERNKRGLRNGVPPVDNYRCPAQFPIRATANLNDSDARGIYYYPDERAGVEVYWCFGNAEEAKADNFRRPYKKPPKQQPR